MYGVQTLTINKVNSYDGSTIENHRCEVPV